MPSKKPAAKKAKTEKTVSKPRTGSAFVVDPVRLARLRKPFQTVELVRETLWNKKRGLLAAKANAEIKGNQRELGIIRKALVELQKLIDEEAADTRRLYSMQKESDREAFAEHIETYRERLGKVLLPLERIRIPGSSRKMDLWEERLHQAAEKYRNRN